MPIIISNMQYHKTTHIHFEDQSSSELSPVLSKRACLHIKHSVIHRHSNKENCPLGGFTSSTKVPRRSISTLNNGLRARISYQEDKHYCNTAKSMEPGKQTGVLTQQHQCRAVTVLLPTRPGEKCLSGPLQLLLHFLTQLKMIPAEKVAFYFFAGERINQVT